MDNNKNIKDMMKLEDNSMESLYKKKSYGKQHFDYLDSDKASSVIEGQMSEKELEKLKATISKGKIPIDVSSMPKSIKTENMQSQKQSSRIIHSGDFIDTVKGKSFKSLQDSAYLINNNPFVQNVEKKREEIISAFTGLIRTDIEEIVDVLYKQMTSSTSKRTNQASALFSILKDIPDVSSILSEKIPNVTRGNVSIDNRYKDLKSATTNKDGSYLKYDEISKMSEEDREKTIKSHMRKHVVRKDGETKKSYDKRLSRSINRVNKIIDSRPEMVEVPLIDGKQVWEWAESYNTLRKKVSTSNNVDEQKMYEEEMRKIVGKLSSAVEVDMSEGSLSVGKKVGEYAKENKKYGHFGQVVLDEVTKNISSKNGMASGDALRTLFYSGKEDDFYNVSTGGRVSDAVLNGDTAPDTPGKWIAAVSERRKQVTKYDQKDIPTTKDTMKRILSDKPVKKDSVSVTDFFKNSSKSHSGLYDIISSIKDIIFDDGGITQESGYTDEKFDINAIAENIDRKISSESENPVEELDQAGLLKMVVNEIMDGINPEADNSKLKEHAQNILNGHLKKLGILSDAQIQKKKTGTSYDELGVQNANAVAKLLTTKTTVDYQRDRVSKATGISQMESLTEIFSNNSKIEGEYFDSVEANTIFDKSGVDLSTLGTENESPEINKKIIQAVEKFKFAKSETLRKLFLAYSQMTEKEIQGFVKLFKNQMTRGAASYNEKPMVEEDEDGNVRDKVFSPQYMDSFEDRQMTPKEINQLQWSDSSALLYNGGSVNKRTARIYEPKKGETDIPELIERKKLLKKYETQLSISNEKYDGMDQKDYIDFHADLDHAISDFGTMTDNFISEFGSKTLKSGEVVPNFDDTNYGKGKQKLYDRNSQEINEL